MKGATSSLSDSSPSMEFWKFGWLMTAAGWKR
jgi:hypothetical protein